MVSVEVLVIDALIAVFCVAALGYMFYDIHVNKLDFKIQMMVGGKSKSVKAALWCMFCLFWDAVGIGSYGPLTAGFKTFKIMRDKYIPGTLQVCTISAQLISSIVFITNVDVDILTLVCCIVAATVGAYIGGGLVSRLNLDMTRIAIGIALIIVAIIMIARLTGVLGQQIGDANGLEGWKLALITIICFIFGALMTIGIGIYAPVMCTVALLGMDVGVAYPIMMGSCAFLIPTAAISFIKTGIHAEKPNYDRKTAVISTVFGALGTALGCWAILTIMAETPISVLNWIVAVVVILIAIQMLYQGITKKRDAVADEEDAEFDRLKEEYLAAHPEERPTA